MNTSEKYPDHRLRELREAKGYPAAEFARLIGIRGDYYSVIENGRARLTPARARAAADILGVDVSEIWGKPATPDAAKPTVTPDQEQLLTIFRTLDERGQNLVRSILLTLALEKTRTIR